MKNLLKPSLFVLAMVLLASPRAHAHGYDHWWDPPPPPPPPNCGQTAPEIDPSMAIGGVALLAGAITVARARRSTR